MEIRSSTPLSSTAQQSPAQSDFKVKTSVFDEVAAATSPAKTDEAAKTEKGAKAEKAETAQTTQVETSTTEVPATAIKA